MPTFSATARKSLPHRLGHRVDISVWQFVRIMVQFETVAKSRGGRSRGFQRPQPATPQQRPVYAEWRDAWQEIDRELKRLADSDVEAFSELMMNQNVILECRGRSQLNEVTRAIENVVHQMRAEVRASMGDAEHISDLRYEIRELEKLAQKLSGMGRKKAAPASGKAAEKAAGKAAADKPEPTGAAADKFVTDKIATGKAATGRNVSEKPAAKKAPSGRTATGRPVKPASGGRSAKPAGGGRPAKPSGGGRPAKPSGGGRPAKPAGGGRSAKPAGGERPAKTAGGRRPAKPSGGGRLAGPSGAGRPAKTAGGGRPAKPSGGGRPAGPSGGGKPPRPTSGEVAGGRPPQKRRTDRRSRKS